MKQLNKANLAWLGLIITSFAVLYFLVYMDIIDAFYEITLVTIGINIILAIGLNLIIGVSGQFSLGHAGFMAIGAYATAIVLEYMPNLGGFVLGILLGMLLSSVVSLVVGIPTLRLDGDYLAIATLGIAEIIRIIIINLDGVTNGAAGISGLPMITTWVMVYILVVVTTMVIMNFVRSSAGRATISIRENEIAAQSVGINTTKYKVMAFVIGATTASIGGSLYTGYFGMIEPGIFGFMKSIDILIIVVFGGIGSFTGTFLAAIVLGLLNMLLQDYGELRMIIYALSLIIIMVFRPAGLLGTKELVLSRFKILNPNIKTKGGE